LRYRHVRWNTESGPVSHVVQLEAKLPLSPVSANLFTPEMIVLGTKSENTTSVVVALIVPVAVGYASC
jgi:hypothetical protein